MPNHAPLLGFLGGLKPLKMVGSHDSSKPRKGTVLGEPKAQSWVLAAIRASCVLISSEALCIFMKLVVP